jgi:hypothetical protein
MRPRHRTTLAAQDIGSVDQERLDELVSKL